MLFFDISCSKHFRQAMLCNATAALQRLKFLHPTWRLLTDLNLAIAKAAQDR
jgi:hypothetical protein